MLTLVCHLVIFGQLAILVLPSHMNSGTITSGEQ